MSAPDVATFRIDPKQLRSLLRLCFGSEQADSLAALLRPDEVDPARSLTPVLRVARILYSARRVVAPLQGRRGDAPLRPRLGLDAGSALALALHLGLRLDGRFLARLFKLPTADLGVNLQRARHFAEIERTHPCPEFASLIGRHRDLWAERSQQIALLQHVTQCDDCRHALDVARETDARLLALIEAHAARLPAFHARPGSSLSLLTSSAVVWTGVSVTILVVLAGLTFGTSRLLTRSKPATPLSVSATNLLPAGWLLEANSVGAVEAVELQTGRRRLLVPGESGTRVDDLISPDRRTIAQVIYLQYPEQPESLRIYGLDGTLRERWDLEAVRYVRTPIAWIDNSRILMSQLPVSAYEPTLNVYTNNQRQVSSLVLLNVETGAEQSITEQGVHLARPSPDGKFIAIDYYNTQSSDTLEIRPFDGSQLGPSIATFDTQPTGVWWAPDSSHLYAVIRKSSTVTGSPTSASAALNADAAFSIISIARNGQIQKLVDLDAKDAVNLLGLSPDGAALVYTRGTGSPGSSPWAFWQVNTVNGQSIKLSDGDPNVPGSAQVAWSPDGSGFVLNAAEPFYLSSQSATPASAGPLSYVLLAFDQQGHTLGAALDQLAASTILAWVPSSRLPAVMPLQSATAGSPEPTSRSAGVAPELTLNAFSHASPDGSQVLLYDAALGTFADQPLDGSAAQPLRGDAAEPSWFPDSSATIGVRVTGTNQPSGSRLILSSVPADSANEILETDPADVGQSTGVEYHEPLVTLDGLRYSFFLLRGSTVQLWIGGRGLVTQSVSTWTIPAGATVDVPLVAQWVGNDDLIFMVPAGWKDGLPQRVELQRWSEDTTGGGSVSSVLGWSTRGDEQGILGQELSLSSDDSRLAIRLRHYTGPDLQNDRYDSIVVAAANNVAQAFEVVRDSPGDGLNWSPDGSELVAGLRGKIVVLAADGRTVDYPPVGSEFAAYPLWVQPNEIWFSAGDGTSQGIQRLTR